jgi:hypothetical protein
MIGIVTQSRSEQVRYQPFMGAQTIRRLLALLGAALSLAITARLWQIIASRQEMWPMPGLYLLEMVALASLGAALAFRDSRTSLYVTWAIVGSMAGFMVLAAWSVGFAYAPVALLQTLAAVLAPRDRTHSSLSSLAVALLAAGVQIAIMLALVRILNPGASF